MGHFFRLCPKTTFAPRLWQKAHAIAAAIWCAIALITYLITRLVPTLRDYEPKEWQILIFVFGGILFSRLVASPYLVYQKVRDQRDLYRNALMQLGHYEQVEDVEGIEDQTSN
jgi:hypothetical protein